MTVINIARVNGRTRIAHSCECRLTSYVKGEKRDRTTQSYSEVVSSNEMKYYKDNGKSLEKIKAYRVVIRCRKCGEKFTAIVRPPNPERLEAYLHDDGEKIEAK